MGTAATHSPLRIWITDGSPIPFSDVERVDAEHRGMLGLRMPYKGRIDPAVPVGAAALLAERADDALVGEAEWAVLFPDGIERFLADPDRLEADTALVLQGLIEGKWLNRLLATTAWSPASLGNNLLARGPGIRTTLREIEAGAAGEVRVEHAYRRDGEVLTHVQTATLADLRGQNVAGLLRAVLSQCRDTGQALDAIDLGAVGPRAAIVSEADRVAGALRFDALPVPNPMNLLPSRRFAMLERVVRAVLDQGLTDPPGEPIVIRTLDAHGVLVGEGSMSWRGARPGG